MPDWTLTDREFARCEDSILQNEVDSCRLDIFERLGGVHEFQPVKIIVTNPQDVTITITEIRSVVETRERPSFELAWVPGSFGGPSHIEHTLLFDVSLPVSRAKAIGKIAYNEDVADSEFVGVDKGYFFDQNAIEVEPGGSEPIIIEPDGIFGDVVRWHLEMTLVSKNRKGRITTTTMVIHPLSGPYVMAGASVPARKVLCGPDRQPITDDC